MTSPVEYLTTQLETARAILLTGAGFSMAAKNICDTWISSLRMPGEWSGSKREVR
jgi:hypothetical protein